MEPSPQSDSHYVFLILKRFLQLQQTRVSLSKEFGAALESCLSRTPGRIDVAQQQQANGHLQTEEISDLQKAGNPSQHSCKSEFKDIESNPDDYIEQVIKLTTSGLLEVKEEVKLLLEMLKTNLNRSDLFDLINRIEELETNKTSECLQRDLIRRRSRLEQRDYTERLQIVQEKTRIKLFYVAVTFSEYRFFSDSILQAIA
ncbi:hypothetical protein O181_007994 [Austropuccinia psidii MF-1]|uniref:Uncharacterized protein n=1 Tax=Austropuccinia psidii MF-1 TaxID=1389203 RepID=A0A9Q3GIF6_9BASI|nr:hypothetical protein [Austropuccinia psidii MF-1]